MEEQSCTGDDLHPCPQSRRLGGRSLLEMMLANNDGECNRRYHLSAFTARNPVSRIVQKIVSIGVAFDAESKGSQVGMMFYERVKSSQARLTKYRLVMNGQVGLR